VQVLQTAQKEKIQNGDLSEIPKELDVISFFFGEQSNRMISCSRGPSFIDQPFFPKLVDRYPPFDNCGELELSNSLPIFCFPEGAHLLRSPSEAQSFDFILSYSDLSRIYCSCLVFSERASPAVLQQLGLASGESSPPLFQEKALCLVSRYNYTIQFNQLLRHVYQFHLSKNLLPIEDVISNIVDDIVLTKEQGLAFLFTSATSRIVF